MNENQRTALAVNAAAVATLVVSFATRRSAYMGPELCLVTRVLKVRCAGCGLMRSFASLWEGSVREAFSMHPLGPVLFTGLVLFPLVDGVRALQGKEPWTARLIGTAWFRWAIVAGLLAAVASPFDEPQ